MTFTIDSTRFGPIEIADEAVIEFPNGLIGLGGSRYALVARDADSSFVWLHSLDDPALAIPVTNPWQWFEGYEVELSDGEAERIGITEASQAEVYVTVRAGETLEDFSGNLKAPILITQGRGYQVINEAEADVRTPLLAGVASREPVA
jgi:flagellar assembly factor FliW